MKGDQFWADWAWRTPLLDLVATSGGMLVRMGHSGFLAYQRFSPAILCGSYNSSGPLAAFLCATRLSVLPPSPVAINCNDLLIVSDGCVDAM